MGGGMDGGMGGRIANDMYKKRPTAEAKEIQCIGKRDLGGGMGGRIANDMYNNDVGKGVVYAYEAYEAK